MIRESSFIPAWWLKNAHAQTLWPSLFRYPPHPQVVHRERFFLPDHDFLDIDWFGPPKGSIVILLHGLTGSSQSVYIKGLQTALSNEGIRTAAINFRGASHAPNHRAHSYHCGETEDLNLVYHYITSRYQNRLKAIVGFSLGANVLLKWLGESNSRSISTELHTAIAVSPPFQLELCANRMDQGFSRFYRNHLINQLKQMIREKKAHLRDLRSHSELERLTNLGDLSHIKSFWDYDSKVISKLHGFTDAADYYNQSSSRQYLSSITTNTLVLHAADDPFMVADVIPMESELSSQVDIEVSQHGGHLGFIAGSIPGRPQYWMQDRIIEHLSDSFVI